MCNKSQGNCDNLAWSGRSSDKEPKAKCGSTGWYGKPVACHECEKAYDKKYPHGEPRYIDEDYNDERY
jgi:hypothetical protein